MSRRTIKALSILVAFLLVISLLPSALALEQSAQPAVSSISVQNNAGLPDIVKVVNLKAGDVVKVWDAAGDTLLGQATAISTTVSVKIAQLGEEGGTIQVTVTSKGKAESDPTEVTYAEEPQTEAINASNVSITNNVGKSDTVKVLKLKSGDLVRVYDDSYALLGQSKVALGATSALIKVAQLGEEDGTIQVTVTSIGKRESVAVQVPFNAEDQSDPPVADNITVVNYAGKADTVTVKSLQPRDVVRVYSDAEKGTLIGKASVPLGATSATVSVAQLGESAGQIWVTVTSLSKRESGVTGVDYLAEAISNPPDISNITVTNNMGMADTVEVSGLLENDLVKVYADSEKNQLLGQAVVPKGATIATVSVAQLGEDAGQIYVSLTTQYNKESALVCKEYTKEVRSDPLGVNQITIANNVGTADTVQVDGLQEGDLVKVYADENLTGLLGQAAVAQGATSVKVSIPQLGSPAGSVYVTVTSTGKGESQATKADYEGEPPSIPPDESKIMVINNFGIPDTVRVEGLQEGDVVKVYADIDLKSLLGQAKAAKVKENEEEKFIATVSISQLPDAGVIYVTLTSAGRCESTGTEKTYGDELQSPPPDEMEITVTNNACIPDVVKVENLDKGDVVKVYADLTSSTPWGKATVTSGNSVTITIKQIGSAAGMLYVTVTKIGMFESERTEKSYAAEARSTPPPAENIAVANNSGIASTVTVSDLQAGDTVKVYEDSKLVTLLGQATVAQGATSATVTIKQLCPTGGTLYVTVTGSNSWESEATAVTYSSYLDSEAPDADNVLIINNPGTDLVIVYGLVPGETVKLYAAENEVEALGIATVAAQQTQVIISVKQLGADGGSVYISRTSKGKLESPRTEVTFSEE